MVEDYMTVRMVTMQSNNSVLDIAKEMAKQKTSSVAITGEGNTIVGILTERDVVKAIANGVPPDGITAGSLMSSPVVSIKRGSAVEEAARLMLQKKVRHLLVLGVNSTQVLGIVTATDLARYLQQRLKDKELADSEVWELFF
jgi:CBS domain-containing protein